MGEMDSGTRDNPIGREVDLIMGDLMTDDDDTLNIEWTAVPLQEDDAHWHSHPEYLGDCSPRYIVVTLNLESVARVVVADATSAPGLRDYWIAEAFQDELCEETREVRPLCPVHSGKTPRILVPKLEQVDGLAVQRGRLSPLQSWLLFAVVSILLILMDTSAGVAQFAR